MAGCLPLRGCEKAEDAIRVIRMLNAKGINATLDHLGEHTSTAEEAANATEDILDILDEIDEAKVRANVSIKLTQIGMGLDERICQQNLIRILERPREHRNFVRIDIEDTPYTDITISIYHAMLERGLYHTSALHVYSRRLEDQLGLTPSPRLLALLAPAS